MTRLNQKIRNKKPQKKSEKVAHYESILIEEIRSDFRAVTESVDLLREGLENKIESVRVELKTDIGDLRTSVGVLNKEVTGLRQDVTVLQSDVSGLRKDVTALQSDVEVLQTDVTDLHSQLEKVETNLGEKMDRIGAHVFRQDQEITHLKELQGIA